MRAWLKDHVLPLLRGGGPDRTDAAPASPAPDNAGPDTSAPPVPALLVLAGALRMPHGATPKELSAALLAHAAYPGLDPELQDQASFPILSARIDGDILASAPTAAWLRQQQLAFDHFAPEQMRALAFGASVVEELTRAASALPPPNGDATALTLLLLAPPEWPAAQIQHGTGWLAHAIVAQGWPAARLSATGLPGDAPFATLDQLAQRLAATVQPGLTIVLACASYLGQNSVDAWAAQRRLYTAATPHGAIPGEGAAGLLLTCAANTAPDGAPLTAPVLLHAAAHGHRPTSVDAGGRDDATLLAALSRQACEQAGLATAQVGLLLADADLRASRQGELALLTATTFSQLDAATQMVSVAASCGSAAAVTTLATVVLAHAAVADADADAATPLHALCVSNQDAHQRGALLLGPG